MNYIMGFDLSEALKTADRVYLCGDLKRQQDLKWIHDTGIEIGVSHYKDFASDRPHFHAHATEYNFVMDGASKVLLIDEKKEYLFEKGSLFIISPGVKYASKHVGDTKVLFIKNPGGDDKQLIEAGENVKHWLSEW